MAINQKKCLARYVVVKPITMFRESARSNKLCKKENYEGKPQS